ncbi:MAG TPA: hypothetical protein VGS11_10725 [Candidatus Bathyarchaeia archaeon]|nr:hypothetical protein [Candidatus Bathyarchaeia archaeon]
MGTATILSLVIALSFVGVAVAASSIGGSSGVSISVKSAGLITAATWTAPTAGTCTGVPGSSFTCSGVVFNNGDQDFLQLTVKNNLASSSATFVPQAPVITESVPCHMKGGRR